MKSTKKVEWEFLGGWLYQKILPAGILKVQKQILLEGQDGDGMYRVGVFGEYYGQCKDPESGKRIAEDRAREILLDSLSALGFQEWIPVGEKEPDEGKDYLAVIEYADGSIDSRTIGYWITKRAKFWATKPGEEVTHWREKPALPALPQKGGGE